MAYLTPENLKTHQYAETIDAITREDDTIINSAIDVSIAAAKGYLSKYNKEKLFNRLAVGFVDDAKLFSVVKHLTVWEIITLGKPNINTDDARQNYEDAIAWLESVQKGIVDPDGWPYKDDDANTGLEEGTSISFKSNEKRINGY
jgi:phage gp36-like protein